MPRHHCSQDEHCKKKSKCKKIVISRPGPPGPTGPTGPAGPGVQLFFSSEEGNGGDRFIGLGDDANGSGATAFLRVAYILCQGLLVDTIEASVKGPANLGAVRFTFYRAVCTDGVITPVATPLTVRVPVTGAVGNDTAYCASFTFPLEVPLNEGELVAVLMTPENGVGGFSGTASVCRRE